MRRPYFGGDATGYGEEDLSLWGYVYDNAAYPANMQPIDPHPQPPEAPVGRGLSLLAGPSADLRSRVACIASSCARSNSQVLLDNACQCSAWQLACALSNDVSPAAMSNFCRMIADERSPCASVSPALLHATSATRALPIINKCFPESCSVWGDSPPTTLPRVGNSCS